LSFSSRDSLISGVRGIYKWSLANIVSAVVLVIGLVAAIAAFPNIVAILSMVLVAMIIAVVIGLAALYFLYIGFRDLSAYDRASFGVGYTGVKLNIAGLVLAIIGLGVLIGSVASAMPPAMPPMSMGPEMGVAIPPELAHAVLGLAVGGILLIIAAILSFIGVVMIAVGLWRLGDIARDGTLVKVGAVLLVIALILMFFRVGGIVDLVATVLIMIGAKRILAELEAQPPPQQGVAGAEASGAGEQQPPPPPS